MSTFLSPRSRRLLLHPNPHLNPHPLLRRSRLHRSVSFRHRVVLARVAKHRLLPLLLLLLLPPLLLRLQPRHLLPRRHRQHRQLESRPRLRHALRCRSVLRPRRRASRFRLLPADVPRFLLRVSPSRRPPACVAKHLLLVRVLAVVLVVPVLVVLALVLVLVAAPLVVVPVAEALTALVPVVVLEVVVLAAAVLVAALVVPVAAVPVAAVPAVAALVVVPVAAVVLVVALAVVPVVRVRSARVVVVVTATNFSRSTHRATHLVKRQSRLVKLS